MSDKTSPASKDSVLAVFCKPHPRTSELVLRIGRDKVGNHVLFQAYKGCTNPQSHTYHGPADAEHIDALENIPPRDIVAKHGPGGMHVYFHHTEPH